MRTVKVIHIPVSNVVHRHLKNSDCFVFGLTSMYLKYALFHTHTLNEKTKGQFFWGEGTHKFSTEQQQPNAMP